MKSRLPSATLAPPEPVPACAETPAADASCVEPTKPAPAVAAAPPTSSRPLGQRAIGSVLVVATVVAAYAAWGALFRFGAYGVVAGHVVELSPSWSGTVAEVHVQPGDYVQQGAPLLSITSTHLDSEIASLRDEIETATCQLKAETAKLELTAKRLRDVSHGAWSEVHLLEGQWEAATAKLLEIDNRLARYRELASHQVVTEEDIVTLELEQQGQQALVHRYEQALEQRRLRAGTSELSEANEGRLEPYRANIRSLNNQLRRLEQKRAMGTLRSPIACQVLAVRAHVGERCQLQEPIVSVVQQGTKELVVYLPQNQSSRIKPGQRAKVRIESNGERVECYVSRIGTHYEAPAKEVEMRYASPLPTLPVTLTPADDGALGALPLGTSVELLSVHRSKAAADTSLPAESLRRNAQAASPNSSQL